MAFTDSAPMHRVLMNGEYIDFEVFETVKPEHPKAEERPSSKTVSSGSCIKSDIVAPRSSNEGVKKQRRFAAPTVVKQQQELPEIAEGSAANAILRTDAPGLSSLVGVLPTRDKRQMESYTDAHRECCTARLPLPQYHAAKRERLSTGDAFPLLKAELPSGNSGESRLGWAGRYSQNKRYLVSSNNNNER